MQLTTALGTLATVYGLASVTAPLLQLHRIKRRGSAEDVSLGTLGIGVTGSTIWLVYGLALSNLALIVVDLGTLLTGGATIAYAIHLRRHRASAVVTPVAVPAAPVPAAATPLASFTTIATPRFAPRRAPVARHAARYRSPRPAVAVRPRSRRAV